MNIEKLKASQSINCPKCGSGMVCNINTRRSKVMDYPSIIHRKLCIDCKHRWTTQEVSAEIFEIWKKERDLANRFKNAVAILTGVQQAQPESIAGQIANKVVKEL